MLKLVSFDIWDTLLLMESFYRSISEELAKITGKQRVILENKLLEGYRELKTLRRSGCFEESNPVG